jgi:hypothetical protein
MLMLKVPSASVNPDNQASSREGLMGVTLNTIVLVKPNSTEPAVASLVLRSKTHLLS